MKLLIIRHGDPDYAIDSLTERGEREAALLARRLDRNPPDYAYVSPLGRARRTAEIALAHTGIQPVTCDWLQEFNSPVRRTDTDATIAWDLLPAYYAEHKDCLDGPAWLTHPLFAGSRIAEAYRAVGEGLDGLLSRHGYRHRGAVFEAVEPSCDTVALFCHFGVECVLLSHLLGISPYPFFQGFCALPTSVTTLVTEERRQGTASFRCLSFGDLSHLYAGGQEPSFAARFAEVYGNGDRI